MGTMSYVRSMSFSHIFRIFFTIISGHFLKIDLLINFIHIEANQFQLQHDLLPADLLRPSDLHTGLLHTDGQGQSLVLPGLSLTKGCNVEVLWGNVVIGEENASTQKSRKTKQKVEQRV